ncbi:MAG: TIGR02444 family protein [Parvibaculaceae bacterium]
MSAGIAGAAENDGSEFWAFSTALYGVAGVEAHLLGLQDRDGLEINLALFCLFAASRGQALDYVTIEAMRGIGLAWGHEVVAHLRHARRLMKPRAADAEVARLRDEVKALELAAEKAMQGALAVLLAPPVSADHHGQRMIAAQNFAAWFDEEGVDGEASHHAVARLIESAFPL